MLQNKARWHATGSPGLCSAKSVPLARCRLKHSVVYGSSRPTVVTLHDEPRATAAASALPVTDTPSGDTVGTTPLQTPPKPRRRRRRRRNRKHQRDEDVGKSLATRRHGRVHSDSDASSVDVDGGGAAGSMPSPPSAPADGGSHTSGGGHGVGDHAGSCPSPQLGHGTRGQLSVEAVRARVLDPATWDGPLCPTLKQAIDTHYNQLGDEAQYEILLRSMGGSSL